MKWLCVTVLGMAGLVGCANPTNSSAVDPFFGMTRIPPPATVMPGPQSFGDPAYAAGQIVGPPSSAAGILVPPTGVPATGGSATGAGRTQDKYSPPGGSFQYRGGSMSEISSGVAVSGAGDRVAIPQAARQVPDWSGGPSNASGSLSSVGSPSIGAPSTMSPVSGRSVIPSPRGTGGGGPWSPRPTVSGGVVDIMDLPPVDNSSRLQIPSGGSAVRAVSDDDPSHRGVVRIPSQADDGGVVPAVAFAAGSYRSDRGAPSSSAAASDRYDFDAGYRRLRGKLEYSEATRRWKLRYIPADGATDDFGGSVVIDDSSCLSGFERGDFVEAHGEVVSGAGDARGFAPNFSVTRIARLAG